MLVTHSIQTECGNNQSNSVFQRGIQVGIHGPTLTRNTREETALAGCVQFSVCMGHLEVKLSRRQLEIKVRNFRVS